MLNHIALILGMLGTGWLALDVAEPRILRKINVYFKIISRLKFDSHMIWRKDFNDYDFKITAVLKSMSTWFSLLLLILLYPFIDNDGFVVKSIVYFIMTFLIIAILSLQTIESFPKFSFFLLSVAEKIMTPLLVIYFYIFSTIGTLMKYFTKLVLASEGRYLGEYQSPRFLGLLLLFLSFFLQIFGSES